MPRVSRVDKVLELTDASSPKNGKIPKIKQQTQALVIDVEKQNTLLCFEATPKVLIFMTIIGTIIFVTGSTILGESIIFNTIASIQILLTIILYLSKCNLYISKQAFKTFTVWYRMAHIVIAMMSRQIYYNSWIPVNTTNTTNNTTNTDDKDNVNTAFYYKDVKPNVEYNNILYLNSITYQKAINT